MRGCSVCVSWCHVDHLTPGTRHTVRRRKNADQIHNRDAKVCVCASHPLHAVSQRLTSRVCMCVCVLLPSFCPSSLSGKWVMMTMMKKTRRRIRRRRRAIFFHISSGEEDRVVHDDASDCISREKGADEVIAHLADQTHRATHSLLFSFSLSSHCPVTLIRFCSPFSCPSLLLIDYHHTLDGL